MLFVAGLTDWIIGETIDCKVQVSDSPHCDVCESASYDWDGIEDLLAYGVPLTSKNKIELIKSTTHKS